MFLRGLSLAVVLGASAALAFSPLACSKQDPQESSYFDRSIAPILTTSCVRTNTGAGCHVSTPKGNAFGNLDVSTFEGIDHRRDLLVDYGPYGQPALLVKNIPNFQIEVRSFDGRRDVITTDIKHAGGPILDPTASAYQVLRRWIENGATKNNTGPAPADPTRLPCITAVPPAQPGFDPNTDPARPDFAAFRDKVAPTIKRTCAAGNCHGTAVNDLYFTCGDAPDQVRWNYFAASQYLAQTPEQSEIARRPLAPAQGGAFHEGGVIFSSASDPDYQSLLDWARQHGPPDFGALDPNFTFFAHRVQPMLVKKGCMMLACHSPAQFHDYRLRGGSGGSFSLVATQRNYQFSKAQLSLESDDVRASRLVRKNMFRHDLAVGSPGLVHRGGSLLEDFGVDPSGGPNFVSPISTGTADKACDAKSFNYDTDPIDQIPAYCMIREWHKRERAARTPGALRAIVYVKRPLDTGPDRPQDFDVFAGGADLRMRKASIDATGAVVASSDAADDVSLSAACPFNSGNADIRRPQVSWDGTHVAFAARAAATDPFEIYEVDLAGNHCTARSDIDGGPATQNGLLIHNFDPSYSPEGGIVFASTRGNLNGAAYDYSGPQRTPANPAKPNADLYYQPPAGAIRQLTYHLNMERYPSFMQDGRVIFTAEKRAVDFYQLALRRINLDGGDYHPLYAQRGSVGYHEATQVVELADKNFAAVFSEPDAVHGAGALGLFNRSLGVDFTSKNAADYPIDPTVIDPASATSPDPNFFLHSLRVMEDQCIGGAAQPGVYTSPAALPNGRILVGFGPGAQPASFNGDYDIYTVDPSNGCKQKVLGDSGVSEQDAVAVYERVSRGIFSASLEEPNGFTTVFPGKTEADVQVLDMPLLATLLFQNTPTGRPIEDGIQSVEIDEDLPPPLDMTSFAAGGSNVAKDAFGQVFVKRRKLGDVPVAADGSSHFQVPGGVPIAFKLPDTQASRDRKFPRVQREAMVFAPGEYAHQSFKRTFFDGLCAGCHGAVSGRSIDAAVQPDILTQASNTISRGAPPAPLNIPPQQRSGPVSGP